MRIALTTNKQQNITDYTSVLPQELNNIPDGSVEEILCLDTIDYISNKSDIFTILAKKLKYNGTIIIHGIELYLVCKAFSDGELTFDETNNFLSGKSLLTIVDCKLHINNNNLTIISQDLNGYSYAFKAVRYA
jgi:2-polyprenyl-3-methyl-5-hydroxy-6-metoxy-1,4-benzoquinol methylase